MILQVLNSLKAWARDHNKQTSKKELCFFQWLKKVFDKAPY